MTSFPRGSTGTLKFDVDICQFEGQEDSTRLEIMYAVYLSQNELMGMNRHDTTRLDIHLTFTNGSGNVIGDIKKHRKISLYDSLNPSKHTTFIDIIGFKLTPGHVLMNLTIIDSLSKKNGKVTADFDIRDFSDNFSLSDLYYVSHVQRAAGNSVFEKHGVLLVPHPSRLFFVSDTTARMFIFYEINHLRYFQDKATYYTVEVHISDMSGNKLYQKKNEMLTVTAANASRIELIPLGSFDSGIYNLHVEVTDMYMETRHAIPSYFQVNKQGSQKPDMLPMSEAEEKKYLDQIKYIVSPREIEIYKQLNPQGKQEFLLQFWKARDPYPATPENEFMIEHFRRMAVAEQSFKSGINSHMGRIYIQYGQPVDVERQPISAGTSQIVEIWTYPIDGRTEFVFVDLRGDGEYTLVHSNHPDEYQNPNWEEDLK